MKEQLEKIRQEALGALESVKDAGELDALRVRFLGKKGELTGVLKTMGKLSAEERPVMGQAANNVRAAIEEKIENTAKYMVNAEAARSSLFMFPSVRILKTILIRWLMRCISKSRMVGCPVWMFMFFCTA